MEKGIHFRCSDSAGFFCQSVDPFYWNRMLLFHFVLKLVISLLLSTTQLFLQCLVSRSKWNPPKRCPRPISVQHLHFVHCSLWQLFASRQLPILANEVGKAAISPEFSFLMLAPSHFQLFRHSLNHPVLTHTCTRALCVVAQQKLHKASVRGPTCNAGCIRPHWPSRGSPG